ncbi:MAG: hypothetical protein J6U23_04695 [Clostridiales bacterium]|nr:hypothetical protein [Clostridiales bacterium]
MANEKNRKRIVKIVALVIVVVMLLSVFSGIFLIFMTEYRAKQNELAMQKAIAELQAESDDNG